MSKKIRLDKLLAERGHATTRSKAVQMIENGLISATCGGKLMKPGQEVPADIELDIAASEQWVSRAALKLLHAITYWDVRINGKICLDLGASTGGFSEVLLKYGAAKIYAVDVGHGQFKLDNEKIILLEKTNCKDLNKQLIPSVIDLITCDVSFISLEKALPSALRLVSSEQEAVSSKNCSLLTPPCSLIALIKPQFEVGKERIGNGVVKSGKLHHEVCEKIKNWLISQNWLVCGIIESPITGGSGNKEFLVHATKSG